MMLKLRNDNLVRLKDFQDESTDPATSLDAATVTAELLSLNDPFGTPLVFPVTLTKEVGVAGTYSAVWDKALLSPGGIDIEEGEYILHYVAEEGTIDLDKRVHVEVRYATSDFNDSQP